VYTVFLACFRPHGLLIQRRDTQKCQTGSAGKDWILKEDYVFMNYRRDGVYFSSFMLIHTSKSRLCAIRYGSGIRETHHVLHGTNGIGYLVLRVLGVEIQVAYLGVLLLVLLAEQKWKFQ